MQKKIFKSIEDCRKHYLAIINRLSDAVFLIFENTFIECNLKSLEMFSCKKDYIIGKTPYQLSAFKNSENTSSGLFETKFIKEALKGKIQKFEWDFVKPNGAIINANVLLEQIYICNEQMIQAIITDISESSDFKRKILNAVIDAQEKERKRFAEDLHDGLGPLLSSIKIYVNLIANKRTKDIDKKNLVLYTNELIDEAIGSTKEISNNLMPNLMTDYGFLVTIKSFFKKINLTGLLNIDFTANSFNDRLPQHIEITLYRIILELINNTLKHANAANVTLKLNRKNNKVFLVYSDDGTGFDISKIKSNESDGMGINNIFSRVESLKGECYYKSVKNKGTHVKIEFKI